MFTLSGAKRTTQRFLKDRFLNAAPQTKKQQKSYPKVFLSRAASAA